MPEVKLESAYRVISKKGVVYWYAWRGRGAPRLKGAPGSHEFVQSLAEALEGRRAPDKTRVRGLITSYKGSHAWTELAPGTKKLWGRWLDRIDAEWGHLRVSTFRRPDFVEDVEIWRDNWRDKPRAADTGIQVLSRLLSFGKVRPNPCAAIEALYHGDRSVIIWTEDELQTLAKHASKELMFAARLAALTGLRQDDCAALTWSEVGELAIERDAGKSRRVRRRTRTYLIPMYGELRELLQEIRKEGRDAVQVLVNTKGRPWLTGSSGNSLSQSFGDAAKRAKIDKHFHDLRGTAATRLYLAGLTFREIAEILAWTEASVENIIRKYVSRDAMLRDRIARLDERRNTPAGSAGQNENRTVSEKNLKKAASEDR